jgi:hypothetical protein
MVDRLGTTVKEGDTVYYTPNDLRKKAVTGVVHIVEKDRVEFNSDSVNHCLDIKTVRRCLTVKSRRDV